MRTRDVSIATVGLLLALTAGGCRLTAPEGELRPEMHAGKDIAQTQNQIRLRMRGLVGPMCAEIEQAADRIVGSTTNRVVQAAAREWKIEAIPAMRGALFQPDPLTALADTWVLCHQMSEHFESGAGKAGLGEHAPIAAAACRGLEEMIAREAASMTVSGDVSRMQTFVREWSAAHPIKHSIAGRESTLSRALPRDAVLAGSAGEVVVEMATAVDDLNRKLDVYAGQLVRQARWEAEVIGSGIMADLPINQTLVLAERAVTAGEQVTVAVNHLAPSIERAVAMVETTPQVIASERELTIKAVQDELARTIRFAQEERIAALAHITQERIAALTSLGERLEIMRTEISEDIYLNGMKVVDHATWRVAQLAAVILVAVFLAAALLLVFARRLFRPGRTLDP